MQFGIKHILGWTAAVAIFCVSGRFVFSSAALQIGYEGIARIVPRLGLPVACTCVLSILPLCAGLAHSRRSARRKGLWAATILLSVVVVTCEPSLLAALTGEDPDNSADFLLWLGFSQVTSLCVSLPFFRAAGYRLDQAARLAQ
jgi:hypothetical protein